MMDILFHLSFFEIFVCVFGLEPSFDVPTSNVTVTQGDVAVLPCSVNNLGDHKVVWTNPRKLLLTLDDRRIIDDPRISLERPFMNDWNLHIRLVDFSDQGQYQCQLNTNPVMYKNVTLKVQVPPNIVKELSNQDQSVREGEDVTLICNVTGVPIPDVTWYKLANNATRTKKKIGDGSSEVLNIPTVTKDDSGIYECIANNNVPPSDSRQIRVEVQFAPKISLLTTRIGTAIGQTVVLNCIVTASPQAFIYWKKGDKHLDIIPNITKFEFESFEGDNLRIGHMLSVKDIHPEDLGEYTCNAVNKIGIESKSIVLYNQNAEPEYANSSERWTTTSLPCTLSLITTMLVVGNL